MFKKQVVLAIGLAVAVGASARADSITTQVTLGATYSPTAAPVPTLVNVAAAEGGGLSYTVTPSASVGQPIYATGATQVGTFKLFNGTGAGFVNATIVETYALQGVQIAPVGGAAFTAQFTKGVVAFYAVPTLTFNVNSVATWGTGQAGGSAGVLLYSGTLASVQNVTQGALGDPAFGGQPTAGQNQNSFFAASGAQALGADIVDNLTVNPNFLGAPQPFTGLQGEIQEVNALSPGGAYPGDTNANLDANFTFLAGLAPGQGLTTGQFVALNYTGNVSATGPDTLQEIGITNYPIFAASPPPPGVPEPASMLLWAGVAVGFGIYRRTRRSVKKA